MGSAIMDYSLKLMEIHDKAEVIHEVIKRNRFNPEETINRRKSFYLNEV